MTHIVRRVLSNEYEKYRTHLKSLDVNSRYLRFGFTVSDEVVDKLCDEFEKNTSDHILFCVENDDLEFVAVGHIALVGGMELAFSVLSEYQGKGMGNSLMHRCIQWCRTNGILKGCMVCLSHNMVIRHLCIKHGIHFHTEHGETSAEVELDKPGVDTYISEGIDSNLAMIDYLGKRFHLPWSFTTK